MDGLAPFSQAQTAGTVRGNRLASKAIVVMVLLACASVAMAQAFSAERYYQECLRFEAGGDYGTARQSCLNSLQVEPNAVDANLALARIEVALGDLSGAESRLNRILNRTSGAEAPLLLAEIAFATERVDEAFGRLSRVRELLNESPNLELRGRAAYLEGRIHEARGDLALALGAYHEAVAADGLESRYHLAGADLRWRLRDLEGAMMDLRNYEALTGDLRNAEVKSLIGRILWAQGSPDAAAEQSETALALRDLRDTAGQAADLRVLATIYYGQGDAQRGGLALREAMRRGNLLTEFAGNTLLWVLGLVVLLGFHLVGESRRSGLLTPEEEGPKPWSLGQAYGVLLTSALIGLAASLIYTSLAYDNLLALLTPHQQHDARAVYLIGFGLTAAVLSWWRVRKNGWEASERLLGRADGALSGLLLGALIYAATLAYLLYLPRGGWAGTFFLDLVALTPLRVIALAVLPLSAVFFFGLLKPAAFRRYGSGFGAAVTSLALALSLATPLLLLLPVAALLTEADRRRPNPLSAMTALWVALLGLAATVGISPFVRSLFL